MRLETEDSDGGGGLHPAQARTGSAAAPQQHTGSHVVFVCVIEVEVFAAEVSG